MRRALAVLAALAAGPAGALAPLPPCEGVIEGNMIVSAIEPLGGWGHDSGVTVGNDAVAMRAEGERWVPRAAPVAALAGFWGTRVTVCATGAFRAIPGRDAREVAVVLAATEFLRGRRAAGGAVGMAPLREAARVLYDGAILPRDTDQICACAALFDDLRPPGMTRFRDRSDVEF